MAGRQIALHEVRVFEDGVFLRENFGDDVDLAVRIKALGQVQQRRVGSGECVSVFGSLCLISGTVVLRGPSAGLPRRRGSRGLH